MKQIDFPFLIIHGHPFLHQILTVLLYLISILSTRSSIYRVNLISLCS